jgi:hypothetical protein
VTILAPTDADAGGTWIGVNSAGVSVALLNRYHDGPADVGGPRVSRGLLVRSLLDARSAPALVARLEERSLGSFEPFTLAAVDGRRRFRLAEWDRARLVVGGGVEPGLVRTSSGRDQAEAERARAAAWRTLTAEATRRTIGILRAFHRSHLPERGPFSVCMHREEAETRSHSEIRVTRRRASIRYLDGPPGHRPVQLFRSIRLRRPRPR